MYLYVYCLSIKLLDVVIINYPIHKLKAQVSFSDRSLSIVRRRCRRKLFTFSSSSPEALGQFQPNLAQGIIG